jgi:hypothetical protein
MDRDSLVASLQLAIELHQFLKRFSQKPAKMFRVEALQ